MTRDELLAMADEHAVRADNCVTAGDRLAHAIQSAALRLAAGAVVGGPTGYASHLLLDARTPMGLPLVG